MAEHFIYDLHIIQAQLNYTYIHIYKLKAYLQLKSVKSIKTLKALQAYKCIVVRPNEAPRPCRHL